MDEDTVTSFNLSSVPGIFLQAMQQQEGGIFRIVSPGYHVLWVNKEQPGALSTGNICYRRFERDTPCEICPVRDAFETGRTVLKQRYGRPTWG